MPDSRQTKMPARLAPTVLVVGGGFAGRAAVRYLTNAVEKTNIILVDPKPFFEFTPSSLRCIVHPERLTRITFQQHTHPYFSFLQGRVTDITGHEATVLRREEHRTTVFSVPFDFCIWATGADYCEPIRSPPWRYNPTLSLRRSEYSYSRHRVMSATEVLIIGAGPIGVELAAELTALVGPEGSPRLTLAASPRGVLPRLPGAAGRYAHAWLTGRGVRILAARVKAGSRLPGGRLQYQDTSNPPVILTPDLVFDCTGAKSNGATNALVAGGLCEMNSILRDGSVTVSDTLQLAGASHFFVAGDVSRIPYELEMSGLGCEKTAYAAEEEGTLAAKNVTMLMRSESLISRKPQRLYHYPRDSFPRGMFPRLFLISLYKYHGVLCVGPTVLCGILPGILKHVLEFFGVAAAEEENFGSLIFRSLERVFYWMATFFTLVSTSFRNRRRRQLADEGSPASEGTGNVAD